MASRAWFLVLDGIDGCGKSTQAARLATWLRETRGLGVEEWRDPGATTIGEAVRKVLLDPASRGMAPATEVLGYMTARAQLVAERLRPALAAGRSVVCDRFSWSTLAYQGHGVGVPLAAIRAVATLATGGLEPDLTVVLDLAPERGLARRGGAGDRIEARGPEYLGRVRAGFLAEARAAGGRGAVVEADRPMDVVAADVRAAVTRVLDGGAR